MSYFNSNYLILFSSAICLFASCDKTQMDPPPVQDLSLTDYETITENIVIENSILVSGKIDTGNIDKTVKVLSTQNFEPTFPGGNIEINISYSITDTLDMFRLEIVGANRYWEAPVISTTLKDTLKTGNFKFRTPNNLMPGILKFKYQLFKNDSIKTIANTSEIEIKKFISSGDQIII